VLRGVDVQVIVPKEGDSKLVTMASHTYCDSLHKAGIKVFQYGPPMLHAKTAIVDETVALIGTANLDNRSFRLNFEVCAVVYGPELTRPLAAQFETDLQSSGAVRGNRHQSFWRRLGDAIARLFSPLL